MTTELREAINDLFLAHKECRLDSEGKQYIIEDHAVQTPWTLVEHIIENIDAKNDKKILVMFNIEFIAELIETGINAKNITLLANCIRKEKFCNYYGVNYVTELDCDGDDMKFDVIVGNPPYNGGSALHQQFFNCAVDLLKAGGEMMFIQPANPYVNNKDVKRKKAEIAMLESVEQYETHVNIIEPSAKNEKGGMKSIFNNADVSTQLAITHLIKKPGSINVSYNDGPVYSNVTLDEINSLAIEPKVFAKLKTKFAKLVETRGCVQDIVWCNEDDLKLRLQAIRGNICTPDFYTLISKESKYWDSGSDFGIPLEAESQRMNVVSYLKTYVTRFAFAMLKMNLHNDRGEFQLVPLVDFDQSWDDEKLCKEFGITDDEYAIIRSVIPSYYEDVQ